MKTVRELIDDAINQIDTYRYPDVSECQEKLNEILKAANLGSTGDDKIVYLNVERNKVVIRTEYYVRSCHQSDDFEFPESIIDAHDPIKEATRWGLETKMKKAMTNVNTLRDQLYRAEEEFTKINNQYINFLMGD